MVCGLGFYFVESTAWFNGSPVRLHRPGGDDSSSSGQDQEPNDGLLWLCCSKCFLIMLMINT